MSLCRYCINKSIRLIPNVVQCQKRFSTTTQPSLDVLKSKANEFSGEKVDIFHSPQVQDILKRLTGINLDKVFQARKENLSNPTFKVLDEKELKEDEEKALLKAREILEMPLLRRRRRKIDVVVNKNESIVDFDPDQSKYIFTDISAMKNHRDRAIFVRESSSGILREASWDERDRMQYIYFPKDGQHHKIIEMLQDEHIQSVLDQSRHEDVLDLVNLQCESDAPDYIRVHERVYNDIAKRNLFDLLRSTRHYGGMVFYFVDNNNIYPLLRHYILNQRFDDASDLVKLLLMIHPDTPVSQSLLNVADESQLLMEYLKYEGLENLINLMKEKNPAEVTL